MAMERGLDSLVLDLLEWIAKAPRTYRQTMDAWRTSCPRLPVWEEAVDRRLVERKPMPEGGVAIVLTAEGRHFLARRRGARIGH
jgi:hypothetical protein